MASTCEKQSLIADKLYVNKSENEKLSRTKQEEDQLSHDSVNSTDSVECEEVNDSMANFRNN